MFDAVIFDWSGTISDDRQPVYSANMKLRGWLGKPQVPFEEWLPNTLAGPVDFLRQLGAKGTNEELQALYARALTEAKDEGVHPEVYPDARVVLDFLCLRGVKVGVLSTHPENHLRAEAIKFGLDHYLPVIMGDSKDKVVGLTAISRFVGVNPERMAFVGDTIYDILAAKGAGVTSIGVSTGYHPAEKLRSVTPHYLFEALSELMGLFEEERKMVS